MNNTIYIVRHGQDEDNANGILNGHRDQPLTKIGEMQAGEIAKEIKDADMQFDVVLSSPLKRTFLTAEIISKGQKTGPVVEAFNRERLWYDDW